MLEKARIHRAMLRLDGSFGANDILREAGSALATIRKNIERDYRAGWLIEVGFRHDGGVGGPEKLYRLTEDGRKALRAEADRAYAALAGSTRSDAAGRKEPVALAAARVILSSLSKERVEPRTFFGRLRVAAAQLDEASRHAGEAGVRARRLAEVVRSALTESDRLLAQPQPEHVFEELRSRLVSQIAKALTHSRDPSLLGHVP